MSRRIEGMQDIGIEITDIDAYCYEALGTAVIAETNHGLFMSFVASLGEVAAKQAGLDLRPLEER